MITLHYQNYLNSRFDRITALQNAHIEQVQDGRRIELRVGPITGGLDLLEWDTRVLCMPCARLSEPLLERPANTDEWSAFATLADDGLRQSGARFADIRFDLGALDAMNAFLAHGWKLADTLTIHHAPLAEITRDTLDLPKGYSLGPIEREPALAFFDRSPGLFSLARVHRDAAMPEASANRFYRELFASQFTGPTKFHTGLWYADTLAGLAIGSTDSWLIANGGPRLAYLWLIGIAPEHQGRGLAQPLLQRFFHLAANHADEMEIGTQTDNIPANRLYAAAGLKPTAAAATLHRWL